MTPSPPVTRIDTTSAGRATGPSRPAPGGARRDRFWHRFWQGVHLLGRSLVTVSLLMVLFVTYQLFGTGLITAREQASLRSEFEERLALRDAAPEGAGAGEPAGSAPGGAGAPATRGTDGSDATGGGPDAGEATDGTRGTDGTGGGPGAGEATGGGELAALAGSLEAGEVAGLLSIPAIGAEHAFVEGIGVGDLRKGPGHYPETPMPGEAGNAAIAGHRTTYGAPFNRLDELEGGDEIRVTTLEGEFTYVVEGRRVVDPRDVEVLESDGADALTLTTCHPEYSSRKRLVVRASLVGAPLAPPEPAGTDRAAAGGATPVIPGPSDPSGPSGPSDPSDPSGADGSATGAGVAGGLESLDGRHDSGWGAVDAATAGTGLLAAAVGAAWWWLFRRRRSVWAWLAGLPPFLVALFAFFVQLEAVLPASY